MTAPGKHAADAAREPLLTRAAIVTVLAVLCSLLVQFGAGDVSVWLDAHSDQIAGGILVVAPIVSAWLARRHVTPVAAPRDKSGAPMVPAGSVEAVETLDADVALAEADAIHPAE